jgi:predicted nucleic acid-binding protein
MIFCDTSTVAKLYVPERESQYVRARLESEDEVYVSELMRPELMSVFHRRLRERSWTRAQFLTASRQFSTDDIGGFWTWLALDGHTTSAAAMIYSTLPEGVFLRSADCLHLVTALRHNFSEIYTHDRHQTIAASAVGLHAVAIVG